MNNKIYTTYTLKAPPPTQITIKEHLPSRSETDSRAINPAEHFYPDRIAVNPFEEHRTNIVSRITPSSAARGGRIKKLPISEKIKTRERIVK